MEEWYITYSNLIDFFNNNLEFRYDSANFLGVCSVANLLQVSEELKKDFVSLKDIRDSFDRFIDYKDTNGNIIIAELSRDTLRASLCNEFEETLEFWNLALNAKIEPRISISLLVLKCSPYTCWSSDIIEKMKQECGLDA